MRKNRDEREEINTIKYISMERNRRREEERDSKKERKKN